MISGKVFGGLVGGFIFGVCAKKCIDDIGKISLTNDFVFLMKEEFDLLKYQVIDLKKIEDKNQNFLLEIRKGKEFLSGTKLKCGGIFNEPSSSLFSLEGPEGFDFHKGGEYKYDVTIITTDSSGEERRDKQTWLGKGSKIIYSFDSDKTYTSELQNKRVEVSMTVTDRFGNTHGFTRKFDDSLGSYLEKHLQVKKINSSIEELQNIKKLVEYESPK